MIRDPSQCVKRFFSKTQPLTCQPIDLVKGPSRLGRVARAQTVHACSFLRSEAHQINSLKTVFLRRKVASARYFCCVGASGKVQCSRLRGDAGAVTEGGM